MQVNLSWKDNATNENDQRIYAGKDFDDFQLVTRVAAGVTSATIETPDDLSYWPNILSVSAYNNIAESALKSFYITCPEGGNKSFLDTAALVAAYCKKHSIAMPTPTATAGTLPVTNSNFIAKASRIAAMPDGRLYSFASSGLKVYDPKTLVASSVTVDSGLSSTASQSKGATVRNGKTWSKGQRSPQVELVSVDANGLVSELSLSVADTTNFQGPVWCCSNLNDEVFFVAIASNTLHIAWVNTEAKTYSLANVDISAYPLSTIIDIKCLSDGRLIVWGMDTTDNTIAKFWSLNPITIGNIAGTPVTGLTLQNVSAEQSLVAGTKLFVQGSLMNAASQADVGVIMLDFGPATPTKTVVVDTSHGIQVNMTSMAVTPWGELAVAVSSTETGPALVMTRLDDLTQRTLQSNVDRNLTCWKLGRINNTIFQFNDMSEYVRWDFTGPAGITYDPKFSNVPDAAGWNTGY